MAGAAVGAGQVRDVRGREQRILGRVVVEPGQRRGRVAVAQAAIAADAGVQRRRWPPASPACSRLGAEAWHCAQVRLPGFGMCPAGSAVLTQSLVSWHTEQSPRGHARIGAADVIGRPQLQRRAAADVEALAGVVAGIAGAWTRRHAWRRSWRSPDRSRRPGRPRHGRRCNRCPPGPECAAARAASSWSARRREIDIGM